jgi:hypothetical protein
MHRKTDSKINQLPRSKLRGIRPSEIKQSVTTLKNAENGAFAGILRKRKNHIRCSFTGQNHDTDNLFQNIRLFTPIFKKR